MHNPLLTSSFSFDGTAPLETPLYFQPEPMTYILAESQPEDREVRFDESEFRPRWWPGEDISEA